MRCRGMSAPEKRLLRDDPHVDWEGEGLEFRLTYEGPLLAETLRSGEVRKARADHKQIIRKKLHPQLKQLWAISPYLRPKEPPANSRPNTVIFGRPAAKHSVENLAERFSRFGYRFVPLAMRELELLCSVEILFLRLGEPGGLLNRIGDVDNRLKTLFDALSMPRELSQVGRFTTPDTDETPFFVLLEDDSVITKASVETDTLLQPVSDPPDPNDARIVITVKLRPGRITAENVGFS